VKTVYIAIKGVGKTKMKELLTTRDHCERGDQDHGGGDKPDPPHGRRIDRGSSVLFDNGLQVDGYHKRPRADFQGIQGSAQGNPDAGVISSPIRRPFAELNGKKNPAALRLP
jgi:hypothetical protein